jgi:hypothetical protein
MVPNNYKTSDASNPAASYFLAGLNLERQFTDNISALIGYDHAFTVSQKINNINPSFILSQGTGYAGGDLVWFNVTLSA